MHCVFMFALFKYVCTIASLYLIPFVVNKRWIISFRFSCTAMNLRHSASRESQSYADKLLAEGSTLPQQNLPQMRRLASVFRCSVRPTTPSTCRPDQLAAEEASRASISTVTGTADSSAVLPSASRRRTGVNIGSETPGHLPLLTSRRSQSCPLRAYSWRDPQLVCGKEIQCPPLQVDALKRCCDVD